MALAREDHLVCGTQLLRIICYQWLHPQPVQGIHHRAQISGIVLYKG
jgi:hypothetical protein